MHNLQKVRTHF